jgi:hypothetical protein
LHESVGVHNQFIEISCELHESGLLLCCLELSLSQAVSDVLREKLWLHCVDDL